MKCWVRHPVVAVVLAAVAVRLALAGVPLIITNDGVGYLTWGKELAAHQAASIPANRTPGYPVFIAGVFAIFGVGPWAVLIGQHALGVVSSGVVAWSVRKRHGGRWGLGVGLGAAVMPGLIVWEFCALTETLAVAVLIGAAAMAMVPRGWRWGFGLGVLLGAACLVRPAAQVVVPFAAAGWWMSGRRTWGRAAGVVAGVVVLVGPWAVYNAGRGVNGLASGGGLSVWMGFANAGVLVEPGPESVRHAYERLRSGQVNDARVHEFLTEVGAWGNDERQRELAAWAWGSAAERPGVYVVAMARVMKSQLELRRRMETDGGWFADRLTKDGRQWGQGAANFQVHGDVAAIREFAMEQRATGIAEWVLERRVRGVPQAVLLVGAVAAGIVFVVRRRWGDALVVLGLGAYFMAHVVMLQPWSRMSVPAWACWLLVLPDGVRGMVRAAAKKKKE